MKPSTTEDLATTAQSFSKDELAALARHNTIVYLDKILGSYADIKQEALLDTISKSDLRQQILDLIEQMTAWWQELGPSRALALRLYPNQQLLFDLLDKSLAVKEAINDLANQRDITPQKDCQLNCCISQLKGE